MSQQRIILLIGLVFLFFLIIVIRLFSLQVINGSHYRARALKRSIRIELIPGLRGKICDRNGIILAEDNYTFDLSLIPREFNKATTETIKALAQVLGIKEKTIKAKIESITDKINALVTAQSSREEKRIIKQQQAIPHKIFSNISYPLALEIEARPELFSGLVVSEKVKRAYPHHGLACHLLGYLSPIWDKKEYQRLKEAGYFRRKLHSDIDDETYEVIEQKGVFLDDQVGRTGIEKVYNDVLNGAHGVKFVEHDFVERQERELGRISSLPGKDILLTIDKSLQEKIHHLLYGKIGSIVIMDIHNGEILAMASSPTFNPNALQRPVTHATVQYIFHDPRKPLYHRAIAGEYALGSIFKIITALAGLAEGKITPSTKFTCNGYFFKGSKHFRCWITAYNRPPHGTLAFEDGLKRSCNIYFFNIGKLVGPILLSKWAKEFGLGAKSGIGLSEENNGLVPDPEWKQKRFSQKWSLSDTLNLAIGQGDLMVTPIQVVRMVAAVANGGYLVTPHLLKKTNYPRQKINISPQHLAVLRRALYAVVHAPGGTAHNIGLNNYPIAGKTSTAEVNMGGNNHIKPHAWFAGFGPYENPRIAFVVMVEYGGKGSVAAAPLVAKFVSEALALAKKISSKRREMKEER